MRNPLLVAGLGLLAVSLAITLVLVSEAPAAEGSSLVGFGVGSWFANAALYVGAGLTVAGAVLRVLHPPVDRNVEAGPGRDWYAAE